MSTLLGRRDFVRAVSAAGALAAWKGCAGVPANTAFAYDTTLRDGCWLYGHDSGDHDGLANTPLNHYNVPMSPPLPVAEAAHAFGLENVCVCRWGRADEAYLQQYRTLKRVSWAITGSRNTRYPTLLEHNFALLDKLPNLVAFDLDDYFRRPVAGTDERILTPQGPATSARAALPYFELQRLHARMRQRADRRLALQLVVYDYMLRAEMRPVFDTVDIVQYWTWCGKDLRDLPERFRLYRRLAPHKPTFLGIYMWDYGNAQPLELAFMKQQLDVGFDLWQRGEVAGFVFHCSNLLNKNLPAAEYARDWFREHAGEERAHPKTHAIAPRPECVMARGFVNVPNLAASSTRLREIRAQLDQRGCAATALRVGGDEWLPFTGPFKGQLLTCSPTRILLVEPSGRLVWQNTACGAVTCARLVDKTIYYANGNLCRLPFALPCPQRAQAEVVYRGPTAANDVRYLDVTPEGTFIVVAGEYVVELDGETFVPRVWLHVGKGVHTAHKTRRGTYLAITDSAVREFEENGLVKTEITAAAQEAFGDAIDLPTGQLLVSAGGDLRTYTAPNAFTTLFKAPETTVRLGSVQHLATGNIVLGIVRKTPPTAQPLPAAWGISAQGNLIWTLASATDKGMPCAFKIQRTAAYD